MSEALRKERIGVTHAARMLNVSVKELKDAIHQEAPLRGYPAPTPMARLVGRSNTGMTFYLGDIMDLAEAMGRGR